MSDGKLTIRDARPSDAPFLAKCIMAGMHFFNFETDIPEEEEIFLRLVESEEREEWLYSYKNTRIAEMNGEIAGALLSYPGDIYRDLRHKTFSELWPDLIQMEAESDQETDPGEYYLDSLAVLPEFRHRGIGRALLLDGIQKGIDQGYSQIALVADADMPHLVRLYESIGFKPTEHRRAFGVDFQRMIYTV